MSASDSPPVICDGRGCGGVSGIVHVSLCLQLVLTNILFLLDVLFVGSILTTCQSYLTSFIDVQLYCCASESFWSMFCKGVFGRGVFVDGSLDDFHHLLGYLVGSIYQNHHPLVSGPPR